MAFFEFAFIWCSTTALTLFRVEQHNPHNQSLVFLFPVGSRRQVLQMEASGTSSGKPLCPRPHFKTMPREEVAVERLNSCYLLQKV